MGQRGFLMWVVISANKKTHDPYNPPRFISDLLILFILFNARIFC
jgi:hypothetical protein